MKLPLQIFWMLSFVLGCAGEQAMPSDSDTLPPEEACGRLFGSPSEQTGLDETQCASVCSCDGDVFAPPVYTEETVSAARALTLLNAPEVPTDDPYASSEAPPEAGDRVCAVLFEADRTDGYRVETFETRADAEQAGGFVTHTGPCGLCSSLADLAVYIETSDLSGPVRGCGIKGIMQGEQANMDCLTDLGFTLPCARIWYYNTRNTSAMCSEVCMSLLGATYQTPDGGLNDCIQCDEDNSGPVFKAVAGRTRRNSGLPSGLCRPCETISRVVHDYL